MDKIGYRKGTPHYFATNNEGTASYYYFCPLKYSDNCMDNDWIKVRRECSKKSKDLGGEKCAVFAKKRKIVWKNGGPKLTIKRKDLKSPYVLAKKIQDAGFYDGDLSELAGISVETGQVDSSIKITGKERANVLALSP